MATKGRWLRLVGEQDARAGKSIDAFYEIPKRSSGFVMRHSEGERASYEIGYRATKDEMRKQEKSMIPKKFEFPIREPLRTLVLEGIKMAGSTDADEVLIYIEERLNPVEFHNVELFCKWLKKNSLSVGHGTIDLRWDEFQTKRTPVSQDEAYQLAMKKVGV